MKQYRTNGIVRISKQMAQRMYANGVDIMLLPCKLNPETPFIKNAWINNHMKEDEIEMEFNTLCNAYRYYNCNKEAGEYISFYIRE